MDLTIAIPTYNGESCLPELLNRFENQVETENFAWEIIIVDNNSTDRTSQLVKTYQEK
jgi:glycosyltransferase involved in cell wall biosynthesis